MADKDDKKSKKKAQRATSNVFSMFDQKQVQEFKEAFNLMDQDRDGTVSLDDLKEVYSSLGKAPKDAELKSMLDEAQGPVNFTMLLTLFGDRLNGTDEENVILNAWKNFDQEGTGFINQKSLREVLTGEGRKDDRLSDIEFSQMLDGAPIDPKGNLDYAAFTRQIKRGKEDE
jgi:Ca2+-binding EF-hand superfamily protein